MGNENPNKKLLVITWNYPPKVGGMEQLLYQLIQQISPHLDVNVIAPANGQEQARDEDNLHRASGKSLPAFFWYALKKGHRLLKEESFDLILGGSALVTPLVFILSKFHNLPGSVYVHGLDLIYRNPLYQFVIRNLLPRLDRLISNSSQTKTIAVKMGMPEEKVIVLNPGLFSSDYNIENKREQIRANHKLGEKKIILYTGRLAKRKGVLEFVKFSLAEIIKSHPDAYFCVVGDNPKSSLSHSENIRELLEIEVEKQNLSEHVRLYGWVDRTTLLELYTACDLFVLPAIPIPGDMEGFGIVLAEANASGRPVISTRVGGIPDAIEEGVTGILVSPNNWTEFTNAVINMLNDADLREQYGEAGRQRAKSKLDWDVIGRKYLKIVDEMLNH